MEKKRNRIKEIEFEFSDPDLWKNREIADAKIKETGELGELAKKFDEIEKDLDYLEDNADKPEGEEVLSRVRENLRQLETEELFKGKYRFRGKHTREHECVMSEHLGRQLTVDEHVHHIDCNTRNNKIDNLYLIDNPKHQRLHGDLNRILNNILPTLLKMGLVRFENGEYSSKLSDDRLSKKYRKSCNPSINSLKGS